MADSALLGLSSRMARLNPFKSSARREEDDEDIGEEIDADTLAGGGHSAFQTDVTLHRLRVSEALQLFLSHEGILSEGDTEGMNALLDLPVVSPPAQLIDRSQPLAEYYVSSSHNTYLMAHQLYGASSAAAYETTLRAGARCIEIDAWDNSDDPSEPKVTHGYTLVSNIPFRAVCETIRDVVDLEAAAPPVQGYAPAPILVSLENHCNTDGQLRLVDIMKEVWGDRLLSAPVRQKGHEEEEGGEPVTLDDLSSKIAVIVEYHLPDEADDSSDSSDSSDSDGEKQAREEYRAKKKATPPPIIVPELAELGVYAQSVKPRDTSWYTEGKIDEGPPQHHLINISESGVATHMAEHAVEIAQHNARHLMRVFPKGTRISSRNLPPVQYWGIGAQICALNWQTFGASMQLNDALFAGTAGYVLKPAALRLGGSGAPLSQARPRRLRLRVAGATGIPLPEGRDAGDIKPYLTCTLVQPGGGTGLIKVKRKTAPYHKRRELSLPFLNLGRHGERENPEQTDPVWDETLEWEFLDDELVFVRMLLKSDDTFSSNTILAVSAVRLLYIQPGWRFVRMLDLRGHETQCSLLVKFEVEDM
ncbi:putative 1-phosphatidylinositol-4,5-bisphosphate phosphodiesterase 1 [Parathielavia hyrcaniae]|uniref:Phosphoinositide phospholipase C n=1 Tax=Parathielavia hyrcaniae TaxID=113614 RepID=A0AAN6PQR0_9PEZI|nr:putative 1-phosphatidylinositol-4,5-bisphosphate phosphodiesterase 1 [Parathielavia hyrcaniae]